MNKPSFYYLKIDDLISKTQSYLGVLFRTIDETLLSTPLCCTISPQGQEFEPYFIDKNQELRLKTKKLKLQLKLCPGVEPPQIKLVQKEVFKKVKGVYTEWDTFCQEEILEIDKNPSCVMVPLIHRLFSMLTETSTQSITYFAPVGWEIIRLSTTIIDGRYSSINIKRSAYRLNRAVAELEISYPKIIRQSVWCSVRLEGILARKRVQDLLMPEKKTVIVIVDNYGEHELPDGLLNIDDMEL